MKQDRKGGYSLVEILLAIVLLGAIMVPTCTSLVMSIKINDRTDEMMQAQLAVSSAVETLMAEGIYMDGSNTNANKDRFANVEIIVEDEGDYYSVVAKSTVVETIIVETSIREAAVPTEPETESGGGST